MRQLLVIACALAVGGCPGAPASPSAPTLRVGMTISAGDSNVTVASFDTTRIFTSASSSSATIKALHLASSALRRLTITRLRSIASASTTPVSTADADVGIEFADVQLDPNNSTRSFRAWQAAAGQFVVSRVADNKLDFSVRDLAFAPEASTDARGSFTAEITGFGYTTDSF